MKISIFIIGLYQKFISPFKPQCCRFLPTCSEYSIQAITKYGFLRGLGLSLYRIARCHPLSKGGYDPLR
ncbi:membrane protein insertion efficiency factor YidD [Desulfuromonas thiophila]|jgi:putative membrane protein insertion efficiency factor|uniref:membrane protein insertion efficiency factor YidD n=1 Tax=Desulfuromonas thiophila TaxID=57664 RepID=UPI000B822C82|nr:membrane protein insertion efficiency factor YidD [Desulfuromonas thiophila]MDY0189078.1 membrane protein insertion efficiency factor YidD [Syntrophus sp. (in: bacteria)]